jgi:hypothetical protein
MFKPSILKDRWNPGHLKYFKGFFLIICFIAEEDDLSTYLSSENRKSRINTPGRIILAIFNTL